MICEEEIIVLKEVPYKENDKILHVLSKGRGKIQVMSRGCRKNNSILINVSQLFAHSKCVLYKSKDMYIIDSAELIDNFYNIRKNIDAFLYGNYILELIAYISQESEVDEKMFEMTTKLFKCLCIYEENFNKLITAYELKLVSMLGYKPDLDYCMSCASKIKSDVYLSVKDGGFYCLNCEKYKTESIFMTYDDILNMKMILKLRFEDKNSVYYINNKISDVVRQFLFYHIGKNNFKTLNMIGI